MPFDNPFGDPQAMALLGLSQGLLAAGAPPYLAVLSLAYFSNLAASLTHYGTTPAPIYFGAGYTTQRTWWWLGLIASVTTIVIWSVVGVAWWKILQLW